MSNPGLNFLDEELRAKIKFIQIRAKSLVSEVVAGQYQSAFKGRGMEFEEVREYMPGDDVRQIDWNVTARMDRPFIKLHRDERDMTVLFLVDVSGSTLFGTGQKFKNEIAAEVTALLAYSALKNNDKVGLLIFSDQVEYYLPPKKGRGHVWRVIREILSYQSKAGKTDLGVPLEYLNRVLKKHAVVFLISDFLGVDLPQKIRTTAKKHDLVSVVISDPREKELPNVGFIELEDAETGEKVLINTADRDLTSRYRSQSTAQMKQRRDFMTSAGIDLIDIDTHSSYLDPIVRYFRRRERKAK